MASGQVSPKRGKVVDIPANAPTIGTATDLNLDGQVSVAFTAGSTTTGGPVFSYRAVSNPGSIVGTGSSSPIIVSGLTNDTAYTFTVAGVNPTGNSPYSAASNSATPTIPPYAFESIATATGTGSSGTITFSSIPQTYKHLQIRAIARQASGGNASSNARITFNGDTTTSNYFEHVIESAGSGTPQSTYSNNNPYFIVRRASQGSAAANNHMGVAIIDIIDYSSTTKKKTVLYHAGVEDNNSVYSTIDIGSALWRSTSAINSISIVDGFGNNYNTQTVFALYGIKG